MSTTKPLTARSPAVKRALKWRKALRAESQARANYLGADEPRAKERARRFWMVKRDELQALGHAPSDEALAFVRQHDMMDPR